MLEVEQSKCLIPVDHSRKVLSYSSTSPTCFCGNCAHFSLDNNYIHSYLFYFNLPVQHYWTCGRRGTLPTNQIQEFFAIYFLFFTLISNTVIVMPIYFQSFSENKLWIRKMSEEEAEKREIAENVSTCITVQLLCVKCSLLLVLMRKGIASNNSSSAQMFTFTWKNISH